jgi:hypothetical protein
MDCQHCGKKISIIRAITDNQYCSEDHRWTHLKEMNRLGLALLMGNADTPEQPELAMDTGPRDSKESACFRIGARVIQPPVIV